MCVVGVALLVASNAAAKCPTTRPNGKTPPGEARSADHHGNGTYWTAFRPLIVLGPGDAGRDGWRGEKFPWWMAGSSRFSLQAQRLYRHAPRARAHIPSGYTGQFQASALYFPAPGCWKITAGSGPTRLSIVVLVVWR